MLKRVRLGEVPLKALIYGDTDEGTVDWKHNFRPWSDIDTKRKKGWVYYGSLESMKNTLSGRTSPFPQREYYVVEDYEPEFNEFGEVCL